MSHDNPYAAPPPIDSDDANKVGEGISFLRHTGLVTCAGVILSLYGAGCLFSSFYGFIMYPRIIGSGLLPSYMVVSSLRAFILGGLYFYTAYRVWKYRRANRELSIGLTTWNQWQRSYRKMWIAFNILLIGIFVVNIVSTLLYDLLSRHDLVL